MDVWLAFEGKGRPIVSVSDFVACRSGLKMKSKAGSIPVENMRFSAFFVRGGRVIQEGIAVDTLLVGCGWKTHDLYPNGVWKYRKEVYGLNQVLTKRHDFVL